MHRFVFAGLALVASVVVQSGSLQAASLEAELSPILADKHRSEANRARDQYRHPIQTLSFFGVLPGQTVIEITPGGGWYTEVLAPLLNGRGQYIAAVVSNEGLSEKAQAGNTKRNAALKEKLAAYPSHYGKAKTIEYVAKAPRLGADGSVDVVLTFRNVHNWSGNGTVEAMFQAMYAVLKAGGTLGVVDHRAKKGIEFKAALDAGYLPEEYVIEQAQKVGFKLAGKSEVNANPKDTKDYADGVWTLPPTLALAQKDRDKYLAIGESDRFTLRFVKP
jgi:predicted methyltransferase